MQCPRCGSFLPDGSPYCQACGQTMMQQPQSSPYLGQGQQQVSPYPGRGQQQASPYPGQGMVQPEASYASPAQSGPMYANPAQSGPMYANPAQSGPMYPNPAQSDPMYANPAQSGSMYINPAQGFASQGSSYGQTASYGQTPQGQPFGSPMHPGMQSGMQQQMQPGMQQPMQPAFQPNAMHPQPAGAPKAQASSLGKAPNIAIIVLAAISLLFALLPWVDVDSSSVATVNTGVGALQSLGSLAGAQGMDKLDDLKLKESYCMWEMAELGNTADSYATLANSISDTYGAFGGGGSTQQLDTDNKMLSMVAILVWGVCLAAAVAGLVLFIVSKGRKGLLIAILFIPLALFSLAWLFIAGMFGDPVEGASAFTYLCAGCSIAAIVVAIVFGRTPKKA